LAEWRKENDHAFLLCLHLMLNVFLLMDLHALSWTGMWLGLRARKSGRPAVMALFRIMGPPLAAWGLVAVFYSVCLPRADFGWQQSFAVIGTMGVATDLSFAASARGKLRKHFRTTVAEGLGPGRVMT
jgi:hypothetical protein